MKCIAFDLGKVIFGFDYTIALEKIKGKIAAPFDEIIDALFYKDFGTEYEKGNISSEAFYKQFIHAFKAHITYDEFLEIWCKIFWPHKEIIALITSLKNVYPLYLISNINEAHFNYLKKTHPDVFALFDNLILSYEVKSVKPEKAIYQELARIARCSFDNILYIDDRTDLIEKAKEFGLNCIQFTSYEQLVAGLGAHAVYIPSSDEAETLACLKEKVLKSRESVLVGIGNRLKSDDALGSLLAETLDGELSLHTIDVKESLENYLSKIAQYKPDLVVFMDLAHYEGNERFRLFSPDTVKDSSLFLTHNSSLKLATEYLHGMHPADILVLGAKGKNTSFGEVLSEETEGSKCILENFFRRNFPKKT